MTDEELIAQLRATVPLAIVSYDAADRIEALVKARREDALELLAASGQAQEAHEAQLKAEARAERLEAALRFYADDETYETQYGRRSCGCCTDIFEPINDDRGAKARAALKGTEHDG